MNKGRPLRETIVAEVAPRPTGRTVMEGEDFSTLNGMLARLQQVRPAATAPKPASSGPKPGATGK